MGSLLVTTVYGYRNGYFARPDLCLHHPLLRFSHNSSPRLSCNQLHIMSRRNIECLEHPSIHSRRSSIHYCTLSACMGCLTSHELTNLFEICIRSEFNQAYDDTSHFCGGADFDCHIPSGT